jgi:hypothetical protein
MNSLLKIYVNVILKRLSSLLPAVLLVTCLAQTSIGSDAWRRTPQQVTAERSDPVGKKIVTARSTLFDQLIGNDQPLDQPASQDMTTDLIREVPPQPELPVSTSDTIVEATFESHLVHLSETKRSIYTELLFRVTNILTNNQKSARVGGTLSILKPGGSIIFPNGRTKAYALADNRDLFGPRASYLLFLNYNAATDSYAVVQSWILLNGKYYPNSPEIIDQLKAGQLQHMDETREQLISDLKQKLVASRRNRGTDRT